MTPSALEEVSQWLANVLNNTMAMVLDYVSCVAVTLDSPPEDLRSAISLAECLLNTLQAVYPLQNRPDTATSHTKPMLLQLGRLLPQTLHLLVNHCLVEAKETQVQAKLASIKA